MTLFFFKVLVAAVRTSYLLCQMADGHGRFSCVSSVFFHFTQTYFFYNAPLGSTVALLRVTASSCIPVLVQPLRACAEPPAGAEDGTWLPLSQYRYSGESPSHTFVHPLQAVWQ